MHILKRLCIRRWGNSLAIRIPREITKVFQVRQDQEVVMEASLDGEELILRIRKKLPLKQM